MVRAPADRVWQLLTDPDGTESWARVRVLDRFGRPLRAGDRLRLRAAPGLTTVVDVREATPPHTLALEIHLPFGIVNHEVVRITPMDGATRVTYN